MRILSGFGTLGQRLEQRHADRFAESGGDSVADLLVPVGLITRKTEPVREGLKPCGLSDRQCSVLTRVYVPVAILGDVGGDRAGELGPDQSTVLVREDVRSVALKFARKICIGTARREQLERLMIIRPHVPGDVIPDSVDV